MTLDREPLALRSTRNRPRCHGRWPPRGMRMATPGQARRSLVRASPCPRLMRGPSRHHELFAVSMRFSVVSSVGPAGLHQYRRAGRRWQAVELVVERAAALDVGKEQVVASRPRPCRRGRSGSRASPPGGPHLPDVHLRLGDPGGLAAGGGRQEGGDGGHRAVLEADLVGAGGARAGARQHPSDLPQPATPLPAAHLRADATHRPGRDGRPGVAGEAGTRRGGSEHTGQVLPAAVAHPGHGH
jgi:hypothetical protein